MKLIGTLIAIQAGMLAAVVSVSCILDTPDEVVTSQEEALVFEQCGCGNWECGYRHHCNDFYSCGQCSQFEACIYHAVQKRNVCAAPCTNCVEAE